MSKKYETVRKIKNKNNEEVWISRVLRCYNDRWRIATAVYHKGE
jgi:hypothetical protein